MSLKNYVITRVILAVPMVLILLALIFLILRIVPGDPVIAILGGKAPKEVIEQKRHELGLDKPIVVQFFDYIGGLLKGDLGKSTLTGRPIWDEIKERFPATLELTLFSFVIAVLVGIFWGSFAAYKRDSGVDIGARMFSMVMYAVPVFWFGLMMQYIFGVVLRLLPVGGRISPTVDLKVITGIYSIDALLTGNWDALKDVFEHLFLPGLTLGLVISSIFVRMVRNNTILTLGQDFVKAARARGLKEKVVLFRYALKNALVPIFTMMGLQFALLLGGAVLTETTFSWPGLGSYLVMKIRYRDFPAIQGTVVFFALIVVMISILVDVINALIDPRVRY
ncbi:ABC transporter permease [Thermotoga sp.]|uniref:ABC transporter permease n=1 Tax=Thermotoga sp. TaxID=28240 RepID=UPI0025F4791D|nr:ABC transporter permease [Thermotoga sp.]MCD6551282.1 ABC transporter permease [Thermotoga sp.]